MVSGEYFKASRRLKFVISTKMELKNYDNVISEEDATSIVEATTHNQLLSSCSKQLDLTYTVTC